MVRGEVSSASTKNEEERRLFQELAPLFAGSNDRHRRPSLTIDQLVIMALLCLPSNKRATAGRVHKWIEDNFAFYGRNGVPCVSNTGDMATLHSPSKPYVKYTFALIPVEKYRLSTFSNWLAPIERITPTSLSYRITSINEARLCLRQPIMSSKGIPYDAGHDHFSALPAEIRNRIYQLVLACPRSGVCIHSGNLYFLSRDVDDFWDPMTWVKAKPFKLGTLGGDLLRSPLEIHIAIMHVNKQSRSDASAIFYGTNTFVCGSIAQLTRLASQKRGPLLNSIAYVYVPSSLSSRTSGTSGAAFSQNNLRYIRGNCKFHLIIDH